MGCIKSIENVRARIEIFYADGMVVGMTESKPIFSANSNQIGTTKVKINLSNLAPGTYYMRFLLFTLNSMGIHTGLADVPEKVYFKVIDTMDDRTGWLRQYWGNVRFDSIKRIEEQ